MASVASGHTSNFFSPKSRCKMQISVEDAGYCSNGKRVINYRIDRGLTRNVGGYYDGVYDTGSTMKWYVDNVEMKSWEWKVYWTISGGRWPSQGDWWIDYQNGSFESSKKSGTYTVKCRWNAYGWSSNPFDLSTSLYIGGCCTNTAPTGISGWASNVQAFRLTNNGSITGWGTECSTGNTRQWESTHSIYSKRYYNSSETLNSGTAYSTSKSYTITGLTPNTKYYLDFSFMNRAGLWATVRVNDYYQYSATTSLESPMARITYLDSRSIKFAWSQNYGGKSSSGKVYYRITTRGSSASVRGSDVQIASFTTSVSGTSTSGTRDTWSDGFRLSPDTEYDLWVWSYNVRDSAITKISFTTDRASTIVLDSIKDKVHSSATFLTKRQNARYYDTGTEQLTSNVGTGEVYITTGTNPTVAPGGFGKRVTYTQGFWNCRYMRVQMGRNNVDTGRYLLQWEIYNSDGSNVAPGKTISGWSNSTYATNSNFSNYASTSGTAWLTIDLGSEMKIRDTILYPYYDARNNQATTSSTVLSSTRAFQEVNVEVSKDGSTWTRVYSSGSRYLVGTYAGMKADGTAPGIGQAKSNLLGYRIVPDSPVVATTISNLNKNALALANNERIKPGETYNIATYAIDRHYMSSTKINGTVEFPVARQIKSDGSIIDYRLWRIRPNGQKLKMTGSIIDRSQD